MIKLKPCPFCGSKAETDSIDINYGSFTIVVMCTNCSASTDTVEEWNKRIKDEEAPSH